MSSPGFCDNPLTLNSKPENSLVMNGDSTPRQTGGSSCVVKLWFNFDGFSALCTVTALIIN